MTMLADAKTLLDLTDEKHDAVLGDIIIPSVLSNADDYMEAACQREEGVEAYFDGGERTLFLSHFNVSNVVVYENGAIVSSDEYSAYPGTGMLAASIRAENPFRRGRRNVRVVYDGGYEEDAYPTALRMKLLKQISYEFRRRKDPGLSALSFPDGSVQKFSVGEWLPDVEAELKRHRRISL